MSCIRIFKASGGGSRVVVVVVAAESIGFDARVGASDMQKNPLTFKQDIYYLIIVGLTPRVRCPPLPWVDANLECPRCS